MTLEELRKEVPELENYLKYMPKELEQRYWIKTYAPGVIIHQKDYELEYFGIIARGEHRVINEFQNGNVFMIEKNEPIDFVGEVTILAGMPKTSVTIETLTETTVFYISRKDFEDWIAKDIHFLRLVAHKIAYKLYRSSYNRGARLFYHRSLFCWTMSCVRLPWRRLRRRGTSSSKRPGSSSMRSAALP